MTFGIMTSSATVSSMSVSGVTQAPGAGETPMTLLFSKPTPLPTAETLVKPAAASLDRACCSEWLVVSSSGICKTPVTVTMTSAFQGIASY